MRQNKKEIEIKTVKDKDEKIKYLEQLVKEMADDKQETHETLKKIGVSIILAALLLGGFAYALYKIMSLKAWAVTFVFLFAIESLLLLLLFAIYMFAWKDIIINFKILLKRHKGYGVYNIVRANKIIDRKVAKLETNPKIEDKDRIIDKSHVYYFKQSALWATPAVFIHDEGVKSIALDKEAKEVSAKRYSESLKLAVMYGMTKVLSDNKKLIIIMLAGFGLLALIGLGQLFLQMKAMGIIH